MARKPVRFEHLWPRRIAERTAYELRGLEDAEFTKLRRASHKRTLSTGGSAGAAKRVSRELEKKRRVEPRERYNKAILLARPRPHDILDALIDDRASQWVRLSRRRRGVKICYREFSFIDSPINTFLTLKHIAEADCNSIDYEINFEDRHVLDVAPFLVFGVMCEGMAPMSKGGSVSGPTRKVLEAVGLREFLRMKPFGRLRMNDVWPLPLIQRRRAGSSRSRKIALEPTTAEIRADQITNKVNEWLGELQHPLELTEHGRGQIKSMVTETLNNAERHGRLEGDGEWIVAGFMARRKGEFGTESGSAHICHLSFLNLGRPISQTIMEGPAETTDQIKRYCQRHRAAGRSASTLATVFAMQDGISRFRQDANSPTGGTGLMDLVEFANEVGRCSAPGAGPKVAILSGNSYIRFDAPYNEGFGTSSDDRRLQWFNEKNAVTEAPDERFVMDLPGYFPGTLITMRFVLDESVQAVSEKDG